MISLSGGLRGGRVGGGVGKEGSVVKSLGIPGTKTIGIGGAEVLCLTNKS